MTDADVYVRMGEEGFDRLITAFYERVKVDDLIGRMYPPGDWEGAKVRLRDFLIQRFGGPTRYSDQRGHPRLRMRHAPFPVGPAERDRWLELMAAAIKESNLDPDVIDVLWPYLTTTANHMMNRP
jgi:hemoglobin